MYVFTALIVRQHRHLPLNICSADVCAIFWRSRRRNWRWSNFIWPQIISILHFAQCSQVHSQSL